MEEQHTDNPDSVFLNPEYLDKLNQVPEISDDEFREFILTHDYQMPIELQKYIEEYMANPLNRTDSKVLGWIKDWLEHPEKSAIYRDKVLFNTPSKEMDPNNGETGEKWKIEIPLFSIDF
jgi:hypothetical protein